MNWIEYDQDGNNWRAFVNLVLNLQAIRSYMPQNCVGMNHKACNVLYKAKCLTALMSKLSDDKYMSSF